MSGHLSHPIRFGKRQDHFADDLALVSGELQKSVEGFYLDMTRTLIRQLQEWIEANRSRVSCAAGEDIGVGPQEGKYRPTAVTWLWCQSLGQHANLAWACLLIN